MSIDTSTTRPRRPGKTSVAAQRFFTGLHASLYRLSGGAVGGKMGKSPVLLLNTTGRKSGKIRTTPLLYLADGDRFVLVASNGGTEKHPLWWLNLQAHPQAQIEVGRRKLAVTAVQADEKERNRLWPLLTAMYPPYEGYQKRTARKIPVVILQPREV